jgi:hypothetical protein
MLQAAKAMRRRVEQAKQKLSGLQTDEEFIVHRENFDQQQVSVFKKHPASLQQRFSLVVLSVHLSLPGVRAALRTVCK